MTTKITLESPTGDAMHIVDLGLTVADGETIEIEDEELAKSLLLSPVWKKAGKATKAETPEGDNK